MPNSLLNNLVAYWGLDGASGANNALDKHTGARTLTQTGSPGSAAGKVYAGARTFDGSTQYFSRASETSLQGGDNDITFAAWVYLSSTASEQIILCKAQSTEEYYLLFNSTSQRFSFSVNDGAGDYTAVLANNFGAPSINTWYFIVATHSVANNQISISVNNGTPDTATHTPGIASTSNNFYIGALVNTGPIISPFNGRIGPVAMWKSASGGGGLLTSTQIGQLYNSGNGLPYAAFDYGDTKPFIVSGHTTYFRPGNGTSTSVNVPTYTSGDEIFVAWASDGDGDTATIGGTGWTTVYDAVTLPGAVGVFYLWRKTAGSEGSTYTVTSTVSERSAIAAWAVRNFGGINATATNTSSTTSTVTVNGLTTTVNECLKIAIIAAASDRSPVAQLTDYYEHFEVAGTSAGTISVQSKPLPVATTDSSSTATLGYPGGVGLAFAIAPPSSAHTLTANNITTAAPSVASVAITQVHVTTLTGITTSNVQVPDATLNQNHAVTATDITTAAPSIPTFLLGLGFGVNDLYTGAPTVDAAALTQNHSLAAPDITTGAPPAAVAPFSLLQALSASDITTGNPTLGTPEIDGFPFFVASTTGFSATGQTTVTIPVPTHVAEDILLTYFTVENDNASITPDQSGWTLLWKSYLAGRAHTQVAYWRRAGSSEPANYTWTVTSGEWVGAMLSYRNAGAPYGYSASWNDTSSTSLASPDITTTGNNHLVIANGSTAYGVTFTPPTNFTERVDVRSASTSTSVGMYVADYLVPTATTLTGITATQDNADYNTGGIVAFPKKPLSQTLSATGITTGSPTLETVVLGFNYSLSSGDVNTSQPTLDAATLSENQVILVDGIATGNPEVGQIDLTQLLELVAIAPSIGPPTVDNLEIFQVHGLAASSITTGAPTFESFGITPGNVLTPVDVTCGNPVVGNAALSERNIFSAVAITTGAPEVNGTQTFQNHALSATNLYTGIPTLESPTQAENYLLTCNGITTGAVNIAGLALSQHHVIVLSGITASNPVVDELAINGATALVPVSFVTGNPTLGTTSLAQNHSLAGNGIATGAPTLGTSQLHQAHALACANVTAGSSTVNAATLAQAQVLVALPIVTAAPVVGQASTQPNSVLNASGIMADLPDVQPANLFQKHDLAAIAITTGAIALGQPAIALTNVTTPLGITAGAPVVDSATCAVRSNLVANDITVDSYFLPNPELVQRVNFTANDITTGLPVVPAMQVGIGSEMLPENITTGNPVVGTAQFSINHALVLQGITTAVPGVAQILLSQHHNLIASTITTNGPSVAPLILNPGDRSPGRHTFTTKRERDAYEVRNNSRTYNVRVFLRKHNV